MNKCLFAIVIIIGIASIAEACGGSGRAGLFSRFKERRQSASMTQSMTTTTTVRSSVRGRMMVMPMQGCAAPEGIAAPKK